MRKVLKWLAVAALFALAASIIWPFFLRARRPARQRFHIAGSVARLAHDEKVLEMRSTARQSVVVEGPCDSGCYGGVLGQQFSADFKAVIPNLQGYADKTTTLIWLYQIKPVSVERRNDIFGEDELTIHGTQTTNQKVYFAAVPLHLVEPYLAWIYVETK